MSIWKIEAEKEIAQKFINRGTAQIRKQGSKSFKLTSDGTPACSYRGDNGVMCFAGACIDDEHYTPDMEGSSIGFRNLLAVRALQQSGFPPLDCYPGFYRRAQGDLHDNVGAGEGGDFLERFEHNLWLFCEEYGLEVPPKEQN